MQAWETVPRQIVVMPDTFIAGQSRTCRRKRALPPAGKHLLQRLHSIEDAGTEAATTNVHAARQPAHRPSLSIARQSGDCLRQHEFASGSSPQQRDSISVRCTPRHSARASPLLQIPRRKRIVASLPALRQKWKPERRLVHKMRSRGAAKLYLTHCPRRESSKNRCNSNILSRDDGQLSPFRLNILIPFSS